MGLFQGEKVDLLFNLMSGERSFSADFAKFSNFRLYWSATRQNSAPPNNQSQTCTEGIFRAFLRDIVREGR